MGDPYKTRVKFLTSLNEQVIRPHIINLDTTYASAAAGTPATASATLPSDKDFFCHGIKGYMDNIPTAAMTEYRNANFITVSLNVNPTDVNLCPNPIRLSQLISYPFGDSSYLKFPVPWRIQGGAVIKASWTAIAGMPGTTRYFGIALIGELVITPELDRASKSVPV